MKPPASSSDNSLDSTDPLVSLKKAAAIIDITLRTVWREIRRGRLPRPVKVGRSAKFFMSDIRAYLKRLRDERDGTANA